MISNNIPSDTITIVLEIVLSEDRSYRNSFINVTPKSTMAPIRRFLFFRQIPSTIIASEYTPQRIVIPSLYESEEPVISIQLISSLLSTHRIAVCNNNGNEFLKSLLTNFPFKYKLFAIKVIATQTNEQYLMERLYIDVE
jgi:hypothetical protein